MRYGVLKDCVHQNWRVHEQMQAIPFHNDQIRQITKTT